MTCLAKFPKNSREEVRVSLDELHGHILVSTRVFYRNETGEMRPGKQGLAIRIQQLPDLIDALRTIEHVWESSAA